MKLIINEIGRTNDNKTYVYCKKTIYSFIQGKWYQLVGIFGDPQGSLEKGEKWMSEDFFNQMKVLVNNKTYLFSWKGRKRSYAEKDNIGYFQDYFAVNDAEFKKLRRDKLKKLKNL